MTGPAVGDWAMQQVAGFLAAISSLPDEAAMTRAAVHRIAEAVDAEVCALVVHDQVVASVGFPADAVPSDAVLDVAWADRTRLPVPGLGELSAIAIELHLDPPSRLVVGRSEEELDARDVHLLRTMAQMLDLALDLRRTADRERTLRRASEDQAAELRATNTRLAEASRVKSDLISMASHELRTPLTSIIGFTETLLQHWSRLRERDRLGHLERVHHHGERLLDLVDDLLLAGRLEVGTVRPEPESVDLATTVARMAADLAVEVSIEAETPVTALVDPGHLEQIVTNLLTNAVKYGAPPFRIGLTPLGEHVELAVTDHGEGVPPEFEARLFERFAQASTGDTRSGSGTGLGLAIVAGLVDANRGWVRYQRDARTTSFVVGLPIAPR